MCTSVPLVTGGGGGEKLVQNGAQHLCCTFFHFYQHGRYLLTVQINSFRPSLSHSTTESKSFQLGVKIFSQSDFTAGPEKFFSLGPEPTLSSPAQYCNGN